MSVCAFSSLSASRSYLLCIRLCVSILSVKETILDVVFEKKMKCEVFTNPCIK